MARKFTSLGVPKKTLGAQAEADNQVPHGAVGRSCRRCRNYIRCKEACVYVEEILRRQELPFETNLQYEDARLTRDYNEVLVEIREAAMGRNRINIGKIRQIRDIKLRAIAVMLYARLPVVEIADLLQKSKSQVYRYLQKGQW
ncbi:MAG: helix-turn-helix domain-containing protein [Nitrospirae bacterium]|nr:helix-turn-helix domain-containing protein [Nitrospirota bacterium]